MFDLAKVLRQMTFLTQPSVVIRAWDWHKGALACTPLHYRYITFTPWQKTKIPRVRWIGSIADNFYINKNIKITDNYLLFRQTKGWQELIPWKRVKVSMIRGDTVSPLRQWLTTVAHCEADIKMAAIWRQSNGDCGYYHRLYYYHYRLFQKSQLATKSS